MICPTAVTAVLLYRQERKDELLNKWFVLGLFMQDTGCILVGLISPSFIRFKLPLTRFFKILSEMPVCPETSATSCVGDLTTLLGKLLFTSVELEVPLL